MIGRLHYTVSAKCRHPIGVLPQLSKSHTATVCTRLPCHHPYFFKFLLYFLLYFARPPLLTFAFTLYHSTASDLPYLSHPRSTVPYSPPPCSPSAPHRRPLLLCFAIRLPLHLGYVSVCSPRSHIDHLNHPLSYFLTLVSISAIVFHTFNILFIFPTSFSPTSPPTPPHLFLFFIPSYRPHLPRISCSISSSFRQKPFLQAFL